jgi:hypothetical protein
MQERLREILREYRKVTNLNEEIGLWQAISQILQLFRDEIGKMKEVHYCDENCSERFYGCIDNAKGVTRNRTIDEMLKKMEGGDTHG